MKTDYPKWLYKEKESKLIHSEDEEKSLVGWKDSPHHFIGDKYASKPEETQYSENKKQDETPQEQKTSEPEIGKLNKSELFEIALEKGLKPEGLTKPQLIKLIRGE